MVTQRPIYMRGTDGSPVVRLGEGMATDISPHGKWALAITQAPQQAVMCPIGSGEKGTLERGSLVGYRAATSFPDGKRILVCGNEEGKAARCYVHEIAGGAPRAVTSGGERGLVSPDGRRIVVWSPDGQSLPVLRSPGEQGPGAIERVDLRSGKSEVVREIKPPERPGELFLASASVSADLKAYAYAFFRMRSILFLVEGVR